MTKKYADIQINITIEFDDDGINDLKDQAFMVAEEMLLGLDDPEISVLGDVRETEIPRKK